LYLNILDENQFSSRLYVNDSDIFFRIFVTGNIRLACVGHTLQLVIKDALQDCIGVDTCVELVAQLVNSAHDFATATTLIQSDSVSIGYVVPCVRGIKKELEKLQNLTPTSDKLKTNLLTSLNSRLNYLQNNTIYSLAAILTPKFGFKWCETTEEIYRLEADLMSSIYDFLSKFNVNRCQGINDALVASNSIQVKTSDSEKQANKKLKLFSFIEDKNKNSISNNNNNNKSIETIIREYKDAISQVNLELNDTTQFWKENEKKWPELAAFAKYILSIPATSAPVERVFSVGGEILSIRRRRLRDKLFQNIIFIIF
jgi:hypothetical protein